ncbi:MAG: flavin-containing monooxygenase [Minwuia sp.]|uniref:flavin-containing monooxygenase n=1 Tax=Minwuia sp. TaxID=2493630 RepID=UPI003A8BBCCD
MNVTAAPQPSVSQDVEHFDVLIVGAGISGIDAAYHLQKNNPSKTFTLLEKQEDFGGTWHTHKYPGIRSDSDLFTFGYGWKPWRDKPIATADKIIRYLDEVLDEQDIRRHIRYRQEVKSAKWSSEDQRWHVEVFDAEAGETRHYSGSFLWMCQGYYKHEQGYTPDFPGFETYKGTVVHPQKWPEDLDYAGKKVVVIGSGATAATLIPAMADKTEHITMLQRSPTYFFARPNENELFSMLKPLDVPDEWVHEIVRKKILHDQQMIQTLSFNQPDYLKNELLTAAKEHLGDSVDIDKHFTPRYRPWRQRLALIPDGDLYKAIKAGKASVVTDEIDSFTETGIRTKSGEELEADIVVTATGFDFCILGDVEFEIDGRRLDFSDCVTYRGVMYSGVPNMAWVFGYFRASWTLRADLIADYISRLLTHMDEKGATSVTPTLRDEDKGMNFGPFIDPENFNPGYVMRSLHLLPKQGDKDPWRFEHDYHAEKNVLPAAELDDGVLIYR